MTTESEWLIPCQVCGGAVPVRPPKLTEFVRVRCRGDIRPGEPMHPDIGHDIQYVQL